MTLMLLLGSDIETHAGLRHRYSCWAQTLKLSIWAQTSMLMLGLDIDSHAGLTPPLWLTPPLMLGSDIQPPPQQRQLPLKRPPI